MQFTSNIIVALLLAVSTTTVTAGQKFANLRGGAPSQVSTKPSLTASSTPSEVLSASPTVAPDVSSKPTLEESEAPSAFPSTTAVPSVLRSQSRSNSSSVMPSFSIAPTSSVSDEPTSAPSTSPSGLSSIMNDATNPPLLNLDRSLADTQFGGCPGLDTPADPSECFRPPTCTKPQMLCRSLIMSDCYCH